MDRVYLDANVLFSAGYNPDRPVATLVKLTDVEAVTSPYAAAEAVRNMTGKYPDRLAALIEVLSRVGLVDDPSFTSPLAGTALPLNDHPILAAAIACRASHLLTGDNHFRPYFGRVIEGVLILRPGDYLKLRSAR